MSEAMALTRLRRPEAIAGATLGRLDRVHIPFPATVSALPGCQSMSGAEEEISLHPVLVALMQARPNRNMTFLLMEYGKPFSMAGIGNWFRDRVNEANVPDGLSAHDLRKAACRRLAEAGNTAPQILSISGHRPLEDVQTYLQAATILDSPVKPSNIKSQWTKTERKLSNPAEGFDNFWIISLINNDINFGLVGPEGLEPPTKAL